MQFTGENQVPGEHMLIFCLKNNNLFFSQYQTYLKEREGGFGWLALSVNSAKYAWFPFLCYTENLF